MSRPRSGSLIWERAAWMSSGAIVGSVLSFMLTSLTSAHEAARGDRDVSPRAAFETGAWDAPLGQAHRRRVGQGALRGRTRRGGRAQTAPADVPGPTRFRGRTSTGILGSTRCRE